jgi:hypothetical protein
MGKNSKFLKINKRINLEIKKVFIFLKNLMKYLLLIYSFRKFFLDLKCFFLIQFKNFDFLRNNFLKKKNLKKFKHSSFILIYEIPNSIKLKQILNLFCQILVFKGKLVDQRTINYRNFLIKKKNFYLHIHRILDFIGDFLNFKKKLKKIFPLISKRSIFEINFIDNVDPYREGFILSIKLDEKSWKPIIYLSGGEKTLSSLAFVFSMQELRPSTWYLFDEIDAALDFKNVNKISEG